MDFVALRTSWTTWGIGRVSSRCFPGFLALAQLLAYFGLLAGDYWKASSKGFRPIEFIRRDLARPLFEQYEWCGAYVSYTLGQSAVFGVELPALILASVLHSAVTGESCSLEPMSTPRGQLITGPFVPLVWLGIGASLRRLARKRWHRRSRSGRAALSFLGFSLAFLGSVAMLGAVVGLLVSGPGLALRLAGLAFWACFPAALLAERLRARPFNTIDESQTEGPH